MYPQPALPIKKPKLMNLTNKLRGSQAESSSHLYFNKSVSSFSDFHDLSSPNSQHIAQHDLTFPLIQDLSQQITTPKQPRKRFMLYFNTNSQSERQRQRSAGSSLERSSRGDNSIKTPKSLIKKVKRVSPNELRGSSELTDAEFLKSKEFAKFAATKVLKKNIQKRIKQKSEINSIGFLKLQGLQTESSARPNEDSDRGLDLVSLQRVNLQKMRENNESKVKKLNLSREKTSPGKQKNASVSSVMYSSAQRQDHFQKKHCLSHLKLPMTPKPFYLDESPVFGHGVHLKNRSAFLTMRKERWETFEQHLKRVSKDLQKKIKSYEEKGKEQKKRPSMRKSKDFGEKQVPDQEGKEEVESVEDKKQQQNPVIKTEKMDIATFCEELEKLFYAFVEEKRGCQGLGKIIKAWHVFKTTLEEFSDQEKSVDRSMEINNEEKQGESIVEYETQVELEPRIENISPPSLLKDTDSEIVQKAKEDLYSIFEKQQNTIACLKRKEAKMMKLIYAIGKKGIDVEKIYKEEVKKESSSTSMIPIEIPYFSKVSSYNEETMASIPRGSSATSSPVFKPCKSSEVRTPITPLESASFITAVVNKSEENVGSKSKQKGQWKEFPGKKVEKNRRSKKEFETENRELYLKLNERKEGVVKK